MVYHKEYEAARGTAASSDGKREEFSASAVIWFLSSLDLTGGGGLLVCMTLARVLGDVQPTIFRNGASKKFGS